MKKDKKINTPPSWQQWTQSPNFLKNLSVYTIFFIIFILAGMLAWKQYTGKINGKPLVFPSISTENEDSALAEMQTIQNELTSISKRLFTLEAQTTHVQQSLPTPQKLAAFELLKGVLEGMIPLETLKKSLQKKSEPWAQALFITLDPIKESKTYPQLEALLVLPQSQPSSRWQRIKNKIKSFIHLQKVDEKSECRHGAPNDVRKAIRAHDISKALEFFEKLSSQEQAQFASWKALAEGRLLLETSAQKLLSEIAEE